jgi:hypothetical protein
LHIQRWSEIHPLGRICEGVSGLGQVSGSCEHGNEPVGSVKGRTFFDQLSDYQLPKKDSAPWNGLVMVPSLTSTTAINVKSKNRFMAL